MRRHEVVVVGGGVAGLDLATRLAGKTSGGVKLRVTLVDREAAYVWKPMIHTVAAGTAEAGMQQTVYAAQALTHGFRFEFGQAIGVDRDARLVHLAAIRADGSIMVPERSVAYDTLVLAVGSRANDFGTPGVDRHCVRIDGLSDAIAFNDRLRVEMLRSAASTSPLTVGIVGGGATGVELAAELVRTLRVAERYGVVGAAGRLRIVLIESGHRLLGPFPVRVAVAARRKLEQLGIEVRTSTRVAAVDRTGFRTESGDRIDADLMVWAAGVKAPALLDAFADLERGHGGRLVVGPTLAVEADPRIFALGDCASPCLPGRRQPVPTTAQAASQQSRYLGRHLPELIAGRPAPPAEYHDFGSLVTLGGFDAYGTLGRFGLFDGGFLRGRVAQFGHAMLYRAFQVRLHGLAKGMLLWMLDTLGRRVRPSARPD
ncbi:NADH dehydrogenase [Methylobacterium brachiatum]|uniref:NADH dehydrogenase n=1 Tax=Methylobacterium brachiatum TaxID=269660 RepID=A0AAJ1TU10_9HYPH|nr:FAD-dependent oxidoreductase [Methylobacterium brachiatum]MCB4805897.1 FAD-dependent oxidoreductase [Methylobacterium brachiatum]MDQ0547171.1 NADH dehydrogenase [Methylobacterium brachiatum]